MEAYQVSQQIEKKIKLLEASRDKLKEYGDKKAKAMADYEKTLALTLVKLRNNAIPEYETFDTNNLPVSLIEKTAKGMCYNEQLEANKADMGYKSLVIYIQTVSAEMNALQSINRHLSET